MREDLETIGQEDSAPPVPHTRSRQKNVPPSCYVGTRSQEREKAKNVTVRRSKKRDLHQVGDGGSTRKIGDREVNGGGTENGVTPGER